VAAAIKAVFPVPRPHDRLAIAAQMQESADKAVAAVSVIITSARPASVVGKKRVHEIEQLHRLCDFSFAH
jgi:ribosomal protein S3